MSLALNKIFIIVICIHLVVLKLVWVGFVIPHTPSKAQFSYINTTFVDEVKADVLPYAASVNNDFLPKTKNNRIDVPLEFLIKKK